jgi:hypothetical protein
MVLEAVRLEDDAQSRMAKVDTGTESLVVDLQLWNEACDPEIDHDGSQGGFQHAGRSCVRMLGDEASGSATAVREQGGPRNQVAW